MDGSSTKAVELKPHSDVAEEDPARRGGPGTDEADANEKAPRRSRRVASLDVFRGLTVAVSDSLRSTDLLPPSCSLVHGGHWPKSLAVVARKVSEVFTIASQELIGGDTNVWIFSPSPPGCYS